MGACENLDIDSCPPIQVGKISQKLANASLRLSKYCADLALIVGLHLPSIKACIVLRTEMFSSQATGSERNDLASCLVC